MTFEDVRVRSTTGLVAGPRRVTCLVVTALLSCAGPSVTPVGGEEASASFPVGNAGEVSAAQSALLAIRSHADVPPGFRGEDLFDGTAVDLVHERSGTTKISFRVDEVFEGCREVGNIVVVRSARPDRGGVEIEKGVAYRVFAVDLDGMRWTWALTGTVRRDSRTQDSQ